MTSGFLLFGLGLPKSSYKSWLSSAELSHSTPTEGGALQLKLRDSPGFCDPSMYVFPLSPQNPKAPNSPMKVLCVDMKVQGRYRHKFWSPSHKPKHAHSVQPKNSHPNPTSRMSFDLVGGLRSLSLCRDPESRRALISLRSTLRVIAGYRGLPTRCAKNTFLMSKS